MILTIITSLENTWQKIKGNFIFLTLECFSVFILTGITYISIDYNQLTVIFVVQLGTDNWWNNAINNIQITSYFEF